MEQQIQHLKEEMAKLESDQRLQKELEFKDRLVSLMKEFDKSTADVFALLDPSGAASRKSGSSNQTQRRKRKLKVYKNPNTGEVVETRGGNQKTLKAWKDEFGDETVESWLVRVED
jgi:TolA-binding protein